MTGQPACVQTVSNATMLPPASEIATAGSPLPGAVKVKLPVDRSWASVPTLVPVGVAAGLGDPVGLEAGLGVTAAGALAPT